MQSKSHICVYKHYENVWLRLERFQYKFGHKLDFGKLFENRKVVISPKYKDQRRSSVVETDQVT